MTTYKTTNWRTLVKAAAPKEEKVVVYEFGGRQFFEDKDPYRNYATTTRLQLGGNYVTLGGDYAIL